MRTAYGPLVDAHDCIPGQREKIQPAWHKSAAAIGSCVLLLGILAVGVGSIRDAPKVTSLAETVAEAILEEEVDGRCLAMMFQDPGFKGWNMTKYDGYYKMDAHSENQVSSIIIGGNGPCCATMNSNALPSVGWSVTLGNMGAGIIKYDLPELKSHGFRDNQMKSLEVFQCPTGDRCEVVLYKDPGFRGWNLDLHDGEYKMDWIHDNAVSSLMIGGNLPCCAKVYDQPNPHAHMGWTITIGNEGVGAKRYDKNLLEEYGFFDNQMSYIKVGKCEPVRDSD